MTKRQEELDELDDLNIIERYIIRPTCVPIVDNMCLAEFAAYYYKDYKVSRDEANYCQQDVLTDDVIESQSTTSNPECLPN